MRIVVVALFLLAWRNGGRVRLRTVWGNPWRFDSSREQLTFQFFQCGADPIQPFAHFVRWAADADPEMIGHLEKFTGHDAGFVLVAQQFNKLLSVAALETREHDRACWRPKCFEVAARIEKRIEQRPIGSQQALRPLAESRELIECDNRRALRKVRGIDAEEIIEEPDP